MDKERLNLQLKEYIIKHLNLIGIKPEDIIDDAPLFGDGLGLDSIDSLELIVLLEREYGIKIEDPKVGRNILVNINTMLDYIQKNQKKQ